MTKSIIVLGIFILALIMFSPLMVTIMDMMCWFYISNTCTGLDYETTRPLIVSASTLVGFTLLMIVANA